MPPRPGTPATAATGCNGGCDALTTCTNTGSHICGAYTSGNSGNDATGCNDIDECTTNTHNTHDCDANAGCTNNPARSLVLASCNTGFNSDGKTCTDTNHW